jgi:hypothetical protein
MPPFENDPSKRPGSPADPQYDGSAAAGASSEAEGAAAHIAELVRRTSERQTSERQTGTGPAAVAPTEATIADERPPDPAPPVAEPATRAAPRAAAAQAARPVRQALRQPSTRVLVAGGAIAALLVAGGLALSGTGGSDAAPPPAPATGSPARAASAPAGYTVKVSDVITDCARHSRSKTRTSFRQQNCVKATRILGSGRVSGRPVLFVVARIQMPSGEAATSVKKVLDGTGTGNLNDLLREGRTFSGAPGSMPRSGYASVQSGAVVVVAEAGFSDGGNSSSDDPALRTAAARVAALVTARG